MNLLPAEPPTKSVLIGGTGDEPSEGSREWFLLTRDRLRSALLDLRPRHEYARALFDQMKSSGAWVMVDHPTQRRPFRSFNEFCRSSRVGLGHTEGEIDGLLTDAQRAALSVENGGVRMARSEAGGRPKAGDNLTNGEVTRGQNSVARIVARLKRDAPEVAERLAAGEFRSARAAGIAAGIVKPPQPLTELRRWWKRASDAERGVFLREVLD